jgi:hypothetical protein
MISSVDVLAQWVRTSWTKQSRGGPAAARRNAAPVGFALPTGRRPIVHSVAMHESRAFQPEESVFDGEPDRTEVILQERDGRLRVELVVDPFAAPRRVRRPPAVWLDRGEWVRWQINYRFSWPMTRGGEWHYRLDTLNLAYGLAATDAFLSDPPRYVDERASLR